MTDLADSPAVRRLADWDHDRLASLAEEYDTPLYVTDLDRVKENYTRFASAFPDAEVMYAAKAHTGKAVLEAVLEAGGEIECAAWGELQRSIDAGADPNTLQYTAVNPPDHDLDYATDLAAENPGLTITIGATDTLDRLAERGYDGRIAIRINPGIGTGHHEKVATGADAKFGIPYDRVPEVADRVREEFDLVGLHAHAGSGVLTEGLEEHCRAIERVGEMARRVGDEDLEFVDVGGGYGVPYREDDEPLDLEKTSNMVRDAVGDLEATLKLEPGRYVVADASVILSEVNTIKEAPDTTVVGIDASLATLIRPAMFGSYHPMYNVSAPDREPHEVTVGGPVCTSADVFAHDRPVARPEREDIIAIGNAGSYGYELASQFHSQPRPAEVALENGEARVVRRRETLDDVTRVEQ
ncbi:diaminopimelate decarboxylase [Natrialba magadii ATCC 43099]|uniref:Diaminopimelate decarboxylase n=1 Tax=Natrialba magadii (strain ATCC 43099 / DSM 3394 / CCM 3739 / CIP 104546 / IAM 13178 / JCM 8861 / NBRC 102185 / NCIMB 2190 / MS3) TaxID=547559 RepID=D3SZN6_NATMM|nr:diaminopimelate decarboxylase [Natrialba magadii]ADD06296.1 diaminopimelate decarboxylase [Natrialba magadii ATCC 43099]ELY31267.1 diaminopimelate decarboxylase [Natrialba magadii ATCC 43099]